MPIKRSKGSSKSRNKSNENYERKDIYERPNRSKSKIVGSGNFHIEFKNEAQSLAWAAFKQHDVLFLIGPAGCGKALRMDATLYGRSGPFKMRDVCVGDEVANPDGGFSKVTGVFPQGKKEVYRIHFHDDTSVDCCAEHLWTVSSISDGFKNKTVNTEYIMKNAKTESGRRKLYIKATQPVNFDRAELPIPPYTMGVLIAEGCFRGSSLAFSSCDKEVASAVATEIFEGYKCHEYRKGTHLIGKINKNSHIENEYKKSLQKLNLWGKKSEDKFIPSIYLNASIDQRIALLQGLMDGDGTVSKTGGISYSTSSSRLSEDFCQLIYSLGGITRIRPKESGYTDKDGKYVKCLTNFRCQVNLPEDIKAFLLPRKNKLVKTRIKYKQRRYIDRVEKVGVDEMQCISVDHRENLYLCDNYTVTHNSFLACAFAIEQIINRDSNRNRIVLTRPIVESGESLGFLPGEFEEKVEPYMMPMYDCIDKMVGRDGSWRDKIDQSVEVAPIAYMRGRAISNSELIPTPTGMKPMGEIKFGDYVIGSSGKPTKVIGVYPQGKVPVYEVEFSDRTKSICCGNHLWNTMTLNEKRHNKGYTTKKTIDIIENIKNKHNQKVHRVPLLSGPVEFVEQEIFTDPYLLGVLLGDGHISKSMAITTADIEIIDECLKVLPEKHKIVYKGNYDYRVQSNKMTNQIKLDLQNIGIWGKLSPEKFIPDVYKFNTKECRLALLQGLMDTDGWICKHRSGNCRMQFCSTSKNLAEDVMFLVRSLGGMAYCQVREFDESDNHIYKGNMIRHVHDLYVVDLMLDVCPFRLTRKAEQYTNNQKFTKMISSIKPIGEDDCTCIQVEADDHLYLTNDFIVTHNTFDDAVCIFDEAQNASALQLKLFLTRFGENSKIIITGDPSQSDIAGKVALIDIMHKLRDVPGVGVVEFKSNSIVRHPLVGKIIERLEQ